jgi:hypothetical protein
VLVFNNVPLKSSPSKITVASDVDVFVVYKGKERKDAFTTAKKTLDISGLQPHVYSEGAYERLRDVIDPMIADGVLLFPHSEATKQTR